LVIPLKGDNQKRAVGFPPSKGDNQKRAVGYPPSKGDNQKRAVGYPLIYVKPTFVTMS